MAKQKVDWFRVAIILGAGALAVWLMIILGRSPIGIVLGADARPSTATVVVSLPETFYWPDGVALKPKTDFRHTEIMYGPCSEDATLLTSVLGGTNIDASRKAGLVMYVPRNRVLCFVAVVIAPDRTPLGRSNVAVLSTFASSANPEAPFQLRIE